MAALVSSVEKRGNTIEREECGVWFDSHQQLRITLPCAAHCLLQTVVIAIISQRLSSVFRHSCTYAVAGICLH